MTEGVLTLVVLGVCAELFLLVAWAVERLAEARH